MLKELMNKKRWSRPTEGKHSFLCTKIRIEEYEEYEILVLEGVLDKERDYAIRMFCRDNKCTDLDYLGNALIAKFGEGQSVIELLNKVIDEKVVLDVWVYYNTVTNTDDNTTQTYTNHYWRERTTPPAQTTIDISANADASLPM